MTIKFSRVAKLLISFALFMLLAAVIQPIAESAFAPSKLSGDRTVEDENQPSGTVFDGFLDDVKQILGIPTESPEPLAVILPRAKSYLFTGSPVFDVQIGSNTHFKVELALAKKLFLPSFGNRKTLSTDVDQNFYASVITSSNNGTATFTLPANIWTNLRGARVFYRVISYSNLQGNNPVYSTADADWANAPMLSRTGEGWYGLPLNDLTTVGNNVNVVTNRELNTAALSSDYGPRNITNGSRFHPGLDIPVSKGTPVYAITSGTIVRVPSNQDSEHRLDIDHDGFRSGYVHLEKAVVSDGEEVITGQLIGYSGDWHKGKSDNIADHLHVDSGYETAQIYRNPLEMIRYIDQHTLTQDSQTYLADEYTRRHAIDVEPSSRVQQTTIVAFGIKTDLDKDLNYVEVRVDGSDEDGQFFIFNYDDVSTQNSTTGVVTLTGGEQLQIFPLSEDVYGLEEFQYPIYVKPATTNVNVAAKDYFFFPWNTGAFAEDDYAGPHNIVVTLKEVDNVPVTRTITIGPDISITSISFNGNMAAFEFLVVNHDIQAGEIDLELINLPNGWSGQLSQSQVSLPAEGQTTVSLSLTAPGEATAQPLIENLTSVIATFARIPDLKDGRVLCEAGGNSGGQLFSLSASAADECGSMTKVRIDDPVGGGSVEVDSTQFVQVWAEFGATNVRLEVEGVGQALESSDNLNTHIFRWEVPERAGVAYDLQAFATLDGVEYASTVVSVTSTGGDDPGEISVTIVKPEANGDVILNTSTTVEVHVSAPSEAVIEQIELDVNQGQQIKSDSSPPWEFTWTPTVEGANFLRATVIHDGGVRGPTHEITVYGEEDVEPAIVSPAGGSQLTWNQLAKVLVLAPNDANFIDIRVSKDGSVHSYIPGFVVFSGIDGDVWEFDWWPLGELGVYELQVVDSFDQEQLRGDPVSVTVTNENDVAKPNVIILYPASGSTFSGRIPIEVKATDNHGIETMLVDIVNTSNPSNPVPSLQDPGRCGAHCYTFTFNPSEEGSYEFTARASDSAGNEGTASIHVEVKNLGDGSPNTKPESTREITINDYTRLIKYEGLGKDLEETIYGDKEMIYDTGISTGGEACGIFGFAALNGQINHYEGDIVKVLLYESSGQWRLKVNFRSQVWKSEHWNVDVLCVSRDLPTDGGPAPSVFVKEFPSLGDNVKDFDTDYNVDKYVCGIAGFAANGGDLKQDGRGDIIQVYLEPGANGNWHLRADFRTEGDAPREPDEEDWDVRILCISTKQASSGGPQRGKLSFLKEYRRLGDNIRFDTDIAASRYVCGVVGFAARNGDINEDGRGNIFQAYTYEAGDSARPTWHIRADFRSHDGFVLGGDGHENWDITLLCFEREGFDIPLNTSYEAIGDPPCAEKDMTCQVLEDDFIDFRGMARVEGGGFSDSFDHAYTACDWDELIEVYINDRDSVSGEPRWTYPPDQCLTSGDTITMHAGVTYDFRGVGVVDGETYPFRLINPSGLPEFKLAFPMLYKGIYGPGMRLEWEPTFHPQAAYYEIQFSEDGGSTWKVYNSSRDISHGGWINHHGNLNCGFGFTKCLKRRQAYSYRLRVLNAAKNALTDWSNILKATSFEWPAHVNLAPPGPPGPYPPEADVFLIVEDTFGQGLRLEWNIIAYAGAEYEVIAGCENGSPGNSSVSICELRIRSGDFELVSAGYTKLASLIPETSVDVIVTGWDSFGYSASDKVSLIFEQPCRGKRCDPDIVVFNDFVSGH